MDIPLNAAVYCDNERYGRSTNVIFNPTTNILTHVVVREEKRPYTERMAPVRYITRSDHDRIYLSCSRETAAHFIPFYKTEYVLVDAPIYHEDAYTWPYVKSQTRQTRTKVTSHNLPLYTREVHRGARVEATDGRIGRVDEFLIDAEDQHITHLVMRESHLWDEKDITIPVDAINSMDGKVVHLTLSKKEVAQLPTVVIKRPFLQRLRQPA